MASRVVDAELDRRQRHLRRQIARGRRRIDRRIEATRRRSRRIVSWRTYVRHHPGTALQAALGFGLALSAGLSSRRLARWLGVFLIRRAAAHGARQIWRELGQVWADSTPDRRGCDARGADHDPT